MFRDRARPGVLLMIHCYFDDSGTHDDAGVVVWGGVVGTVDQFNQLEKRWRECLSAPMPGRPPLARFHLSHCKMRMREFARYNDAEIDHVQYRFRNVIIESGAMPVAFGVDKTAWDRFVTGKLRERLGGGAEALAFGSCAKAALEIAEDDKRGMQIVFDKGRETENLRLVFRAAEELVPAVTGHSAKFLAVADYPGLQAADMVANYFYVYAQNWLTDCESDLGPHFLHMVDRVEQQHWAMFGSDQVRELAARLRKSLRI